MRDVKPYLWIGVLGLGLAGCGGSDRDLVPTAPETPESIDFGAHAFQLTIDARTGEIEVNGPRTAMSARVIQNAPSFSLIGSDGVEFEVRSGCQFAPIPNRPRHRRCTFRVELTNRMQGVDLVTPTEFPRPPAGVTGILLFPWTAVAEGGTDPTAVPSPDWDHGPVDFFNDFVGCSSGGKSDCYRYETLPSPVYGGSFAGTPEIGFDIPIDATRVTAYIVVAADLRPNRQVTFPVFASQCNDVKSDGTFGNLPELEVGRLHDDPVKRAFCIFDNPLPSDALLVTGEIRVTFTQGGGNVRAEYLDFGPTIDVEDFDLPSTTDPRPFQCCREAGRSFAGVSGVQEANDAGVEELGFRFTAEDEESGRSLFTGSGTVDRPVLELTWIRR